jgi:TM2 domain-containing membrane protein YozV
MSEEMTPSELTGKELEEAKNKKMLAGILAILLGGLGIHKFVLGITTPGVIMLLVSVLTCGIAYPIMHVIGIVEGIIYLTKSDEEFYQMYIVDKKAWL